MKEVCISDLQQQAHLQNRLSETVACRALYVVQPPPLPSTLIALDSIFRTYHLNMKLPMLSAMPSDPASGE